MARNNKQITGELAKEYCKKFQTSATREIARDVDNSPPHPEAVPRYGARKRLSRY